MKHSRCLHIVSLSQRFFPARRPLGAVLLKTNKQKKTIRALNPPNSSNLQVIIKDLLLLRHHISSPKPSKNYWRLQPHQPKAPFHFLKKKKKINKDFFLLPWKWDDRTREFAGPSQQGLSVGLVPFHRGPGGPRTSSLRVCLCGSSKRCCWRRSPFTWSVWSELEAFLPAGLLVAILRIKIRRHCVSSSQERQLRNCFGQLRNENKPPEVALADWGGCWA